MTQIELDGQTIERVSEQPPLIVDTSGKWALTAEAALTFTGADGTARRYEGDDPQAVTALAALLQGLAIRAATVTEDGLLRIVFVGGAELIAPPDPQYESWDAVGPAGQRIVCMPGGELAIWDAEEADE
jgi:hypothetical protein